jgi:outer membrane receptor protein involved in Fe transport
VVQGGPVQSLWSPTYMVGTFLAGYRTKIFNRTTTFALNIDNVLDKDYYLSATINTGSWGPPRGYRFAMTTDF